MSDILACKTCNLCKYAEWDYIDAYRGGYWGVCGCNLPADAPITDEEIITEEELKKLNNEWDDDWGNDKDCPFFVDGTQEVDNDYLNYIGEEIKEEDFTS